MEIAKLLSKREEACAMDCMLFRRWEMGLIPTSLTIRQFCKNNRVPIDTEITPSEMEAFMNSLGYIKERNV